MAEPFETPRPAEASWRAKLHEVIFEADTPAGKAFDVALLVAIVASVVLVMIESVESYGKRYEGVLRVGEWILTILFTGEYVLRLACVKRPVLYARSFFGVVDLLAVMPTYLAAFVPGAHTFMVVRAFRLLRIFRVFKLARMVSEAAVLRRALVQSRAKIVVFMTAVLVIVAITGATMYFVEGDREGSAFDSIPQSMYWAIVTMTTVGYGDIAPQSPFGKFLAAIVMVLGYSMIVVPTGIITAELTLQGRPVSTQACPGCSREGHDPDAAHCKFCGESL